MDDLQLWPLDLNVYVKQDHKACALIIFFNKSHGSWNVMNNNVWKRISKYGWVLCFSLPQIFPHGTPQCGNDRPAVVDETVPVAGSSACAPGPSCIWGRSGTLPLQVAVLVTGLAGGSLEDPPAPLTESVDWKDQWFESEVEVMQYVDI